MSEMTKESIVVNHNIREVYIFLDPAALMYVEPDYTKTTYEETQTALLAFGDIKMTQEQQTVVNQDIKAAMTKELQEEELLEIANQKAIERVGELIEPLIKEIVPGYKVMIQQKNKATP